MQERRRFVRLDTRLPVSYQVLPSEPRQTSISADLSGGGMCLFVNEPLKLGTPLRVTISLPDRDRPIAFTAEVVWCEAYEMIGKTQRSRSIEAGVKFLQIAPEDQQAIMRYVILSLQPQT